MKEITPNRYVVSQGERITIRITSYAVPAMISALLDGASIDVNPTLSFTASKSVGDEHVLQLAFGFLPEAQADARYDVEVSGSGGGSFVSSVAGTTSPIVRTLLFFIGDTGPK
jgi:hypothetical protein